MKNQDLKNEIDSMVAQAIMASVLSVMFNVWAGESEKNLNSARAVLELTRDLVKERGKEMGLTHVGWDNSVDEILKMWTNSLDGVEQKVKYVGIMETGDQQ